MMESLLAGFPVRVEQAVAWGEMDYYRHVNNVVYFRYFENARLEYFRKVGWLEFEQRTGVGPILQATQARFRRPLTFPDTITAAARIRAIGEDRMTMDYLIVSHGQQVVATEGNGTIVTFHYKEGKKVQVPDELRRLIEGLEGKSL